MAIPLENDTNRGISSLLSDEQVDHLISEVKDWQITHGSLLKIVGREEDHTVPAIPIGAALTPTPFPRRCFEQACALQTSYNCLYAAVAEDDIWLENVLKDLIDGDEHVETLWRMHCKAKQQPSVQDLNLGIFRSDYMLHSCHQSLEDARIRQVELNTFSCAGGSHSNIVSDMHRHLHRKGAYGSTGKSSTTSSSQLPANDTIKGIVSGLAVGHNAYGRAINQGTQGTCILMVVQPLNVNICDERPIEYGLWGQSVPVFRIDWGDLSTQTSIGRHSELLYHPVVTSKSSIDSWEVSVVYLRAGHDPVEYDKKGQTARVDIECSRAIKCPTISCHLATLKKVQQALILPGAVERFISEDEAALVRKTFVAMYPLDDSPDGIRGCSLATNPATAVNFVLKPSREGGGHNVYRTDIVGFLSRIPKSQWGQYVLMELILPPPIQNILMSPAGLHEGDVISELGIFGSCLWRSEGVGKPAEMVANAQLGWSFKTKSTDVDEMSVVKGYGCFDSPLLLDGH